MKTAGCCQLCTTTGRCRDVCRLLNLAPECMVRRRVLLPHNKYKTMTIVVFAYLFAKKSRPGAWATPSQRRCLSFKACMFFNTLVYHTASFVLINPQLSRVSACQHAAIRILLVVERPCESRALFKLEFEQVRTSAHFSVMFFRHAWSSRASKR